MQITVPSFAKINLDLRVLHRNPDGFHELRTIFQTVSLRDTLTVGFVPQKRTQVAVESSVEIPGENLVVRSAKLALDALKLRAQVRISLKKRIPMGAGLGGGSSNAAAVLLALRSLARRQLDPAAWVRMAESLGSDVPFFLHGGTAVGIGRGAETFPAPDLPPIPAVVIASGIHVSTRDAYAALARKPLDELTSPAESPILREFQTVAWELDATRLDQLPLKNDFEEAVFGMHQELPALARKLRRFGARLVRMSGSGSAIFGLFDSPAAARQAASRFPAGTAHAVRFVSRRQYEAAFRRARAGASAAETR